MWEICEKPCVYCTQPFEFPFVFAGYKECYKTRGFNLIC